MDATAVRSLARELQVTSSSHERTLYFHGTSMEPFLREGDRVVVEPVDWDDLSVGDVITYTDGEKFPTRRIYRKDAESVHLRCDNWLYYRVDVQRQDLVGRAIARHRDGSWLRSDDAAWGDASQRARLASRRDDVTKALATPVLRVLRALHLR